LVYLTHFSTVFCVFGLVLEGKPVRVTGKGPYGSGYGYTPRYLRVTRAFAYVVLAIRARARARATRSKNELKLNYVT
jgi:hypothetical protein